MELQVSADEDAAHVIGVSRDFGGGQGITAGDLKAALSEQGVVEGLCEDALESLANILARGEGYAGELILVARGKPPGDGRDGKLVLLPPEEADLGKGNLTWLVFPGEKVAKIVPPSCGEPGVTVRGNEIPGELGDEAKINLGAGVELGADGEDVIANVAGFAKFDWKSISVAPPVTVSRDKMTAYVDIIAPEEVIGSLDVQGYHKMLRASGVVHGIDEKAIEKALKEAVETGAGKQGVVVAKGTESEPGEDAKIAYTFSLDVKPGLLLPDGRMDYRERGFVQNVASGEDLAIKTPPTLGTPGSTVTGDPLAPRPGMDIKLKALENVGYSEDELKLVAKREGVAVREPTGGVRVISEFVVRGDVNYATGNVRCKGSVRIEGSVLPDFSVESEHEVLIDGGLDSANVNAGGNMIVGHGIHGSANTEIVCGGEIRATFIENATIHAVGDIILGQSLRHSHVRTTGAVKVTERKGTIVGGKVFATRGILANEVGSEIGTQTELTVGVDTAKLTHVEELEGQIDEFEEQLRQLDSRLGPVAQKSQQGEFHGRTKAWIADLLKERGQVVSERDKILELRDKLVAGMQSDLTAKVRILGTVHPGIVIRIGEETYSLGARKRNVTFMYNERGREVVCVEER
jgi:uncharacterized protein (DUF342 family)